MELDFTAVFATASYFTVSCARLIQPKPPFYLKIHFNIIFPRNPESSEASLFLMFSNQTHLPMYLTPRTLRLSLSLYLPAAPPPAPVKFGEACNIIRVNKYNGLLVQWQPRRSSPPALPLNQFHTEFILLRLFEVNLTHITAVSRNSLNIHHVEKYLKKCCIHFMLCFKFLYK
jgi:hypothetical protein